MTASGRKQSTVRLISSPPAPVARSEEENEKEWTQPTRLDNSNEQEDGKAKRKRKKIKGEKLLTSTKSGTQVA